MVLGMSSVVNFVTNRLDSITNITKITDAKCLMNTLYTTVHCCTFV